MAVVTSPGVTEVALFGTFQGRPWASVLHVQRMASGTGTGGGDFKGENVARDTMEAFQEHVLPQLGNTVVLGGARWMDLDSDDSDRGAHGPTSGLPSSGGIAPAHLPPNCTLLVRKMATGGRGTKTGRWFLPGVSDGFVGDDGVLASAYRTTMGNALTAFLTAVGDDPETGPTLVVLRRPALARQPGSQVVPVEADTVTQLQLDPKIATQRRRLRG